jgi:hypothetical protein
MVAMFGPCALCGVPADLQNSHIVPAFFDRRLRADAGTPFMRGANPNQRVQSGPKMYLLCSACEGRFSKAEAEFAETVYHPTLDGQFFEMVCTRGLASFVASLSWRNLVSTMQKHPGPLEGVWTPADWTAMLAAEVRLRQYLLEQSPYPREIEHHVFATGADAQTAHPGVNTVLNMAVTVGMPATDHCVYSLVTVPGMVFIGLLNPTHECRAMWRGGTLVAPGIIFRNHRQTIKDGHAGYYLVESGKRFTEQHSRISPKQRTVLREAAARHKASGKRPSARIARAALQDLDNSRDSSEQGSCDG